jgi:catechol 1,2-dioxygenase
MNTANARVRQEERLREVFENLLATVKDFVQHHEVTHDEYRRAVEFLCETARQGELTLLCDVFLEATVDAVESSGRMGTASSVEGPYYVPEAPVLRSPCVLPHRANEPGEPMLFHGTVRATDGTPLDGVMLDVWQADANGAYSHFDVAKEAAPYNLRARVFCDERGRFEIRTWVSAPYHIPKDGPTGGLLTALGRHPYRPAHIHVKLSHPQCLPLTTQLFYEGDPYLDSDVVGAVKAPLIVRLVKQEDPAEIRRQGLGSPFYALKYDFVLPHRTAKAA